MSIWGMPSVEEQPTVTQVRWRVLRLKAKKISIDLVLGWCLEDRHARMSTPIISHDVNRRTLTTKSGRLYVVQGDSDYDDDAQYILEEHFDLAARRAVDVSSEYFDGRLPSEQEIENVKLSKVESRRFLRNADLPFQPKAKLTRHFKSQ